MSFLCYVTVLLFLVALGNAARAPSITPPKTLGPGETPIQDPGWQHCINYMKAIWPWQKLKNENYPKFGGTQLQCSWILEAPIGWRVKIAFQDLYMTQPTGKSCRAQYVEIIDLGTKKTQGRFCGRKPPGDYVSQGSLLRIDLHGVKTARGPYRGFLLRFKFIKQPPGFRDQKMFFTTLTTSPGRANVNNFLSQQQRRLLSQRKPGPKPPGKFVYASDRKPTPSTQPAPDSGWQGDDGTFTQPQRTNQRPKIPAGAKIAAKIRPTPKGANGNRIFAVNQRTIATSKSPDYGSDDGWEEIPSNNQPATVRRFYGDNNQPIIPTDDTTVKPASTSSGGISTTHLIIIVVAVIACFLIIVAVYFIKRLYFDKLKQIKKELKNEKENSESIAGGEFNRSQSLPGLSRSGSLRSTKSAGQVSYRNTPLPPIPHNTLMTSRPPTSQLHHHHNHNRSRTLSHVPKPHAIYGNERTMTLQAGHVMPRHLLRHSQRRDVTFQRPLPEVPKEKANDVDEDYCSGSDADADVTTLRRVFSKWEMDEKKRRRR